MKKKSYLPYGILILMICLISYEILKTKPITEVFITLSTDTETDSGTKGNVFLTINDDEQNKYLLDIPNKADRNKGVSTKYHFNINENIENIYTIELSIKGTDAWKMREFTIHFISNNQYSAKYIDSKKKWFSEEQYDQDKFNAKASYRYLTDIKVYDYKDVPTLPLL